MPPELVEKTARAIAYGHFARKHHHGVGSKIAANKHQADKYWRTFIPDAMLVLAVLASEASPV